MTPQPRPAPRLELLEERGRLRFGRRVVTCGIYRTDAPGVEVRASFSEGDLLLSQRVRDLDAARRLATEWREAVVAKGGFTEPSS